MSICQNKMKEVIDGLVRHYTKEGPVVLLESQSETHSASRYSYLAALPEATIKANGRQIEVVEGDQLFRFEENPWKALADFQKKRNGYLFGYLGYDLKNHIEQLQSNNSDSISAPDLFFMVPSLLLKIDHQKNSVEAVKGKLPDYEISTSGMNEVSITGIKGSVRRKDYISKIKQIQQDIYDGKYYELNFTHQLRSDFTGASYRLYQKMRDSGPVPFGAYVAFDDLNICCASPERFLSKKGKTVFSQPIKGTMKRHANELKDEKLKQKLMQSLKNRAENMMIVDLVRNDLSRIARKGSVVVKGLFEIQTFSTLHQMISTIAAVTDEEDPAEIIKACFPMGSMTGAPKVSVMQAIEELENYRRGIYSGAMGYITPGGDFDFNVAIRTAIIKQNELYYSVGGAITADSDPEEEWEESWLKAEALLKAVE